MHGDRYTVMHGDDLWSIAAKTLGNGFYWPSIWRYNNRAAISRLTGANLPDPDALSPGRQLMIPRLHGHVVPSLTHTAHAGPAARRLGLTLADIHAPLAFKYVIDLRWPQRDAGAALLDVRLTGDLVLMTRDTYPATYVTSRREIEHQVTREANHTFGTLVNDHRFIYAPETNTLTYRSMLLSRSTTPNVPAVGVGTLVGSDSPVPRLRAEMRLPRLTGTHGRFRYVALDIKLAVEITPKPNTGPHGRVGPANPAPSTEPLWSRLVGVGLVATTGALVVAALVDDFVPPFAGLADDALIATAASSMLARGLALMGGTSDNLPNASVPAHVHATAAISRDTP
ncbi:MAG: hypothetical protein ABW321_02105 [Polyangiales bacterium]